MKNEYAGRLNILTRVSTGSKVGQTVEYQQGWSRLERTEDRGDDKMCTLTTYLTVTVQCGATEEN